MRLKSLFGGLYFPLKLVFLISLTLPLFFWTSQLFSFSNAAEPTHAQQSAAEKAARLLPGKKRVRGLDVSHYQGLVQWEKVAQAGMTFAIIKATGGLDYVDPRFHENWHGTRAANLYRGAYHFFYAAEDAGQQAEHFIKTMGPLRAQDLPPVLDVEILDHTDLTHLRQGVLTWLQAVEQATGRRPILYTDNGFADTVLIDPALSRYPLWLADYTETIKRLPAPWKATGWTFWQYTATGQVDGISQPVALDHFKGSQQDFLRFIAQSAQ